MDFLDLYDGLRYAQLEKFFPDSGKVINYLFKRKRLHRSLDQQYISTNPDFSPDKTLIAALGVLGDVYEKVRNHARVSAPAQLSFSTHNNDHYEIIYVAYGLEAMVSASFKARRGLQKEERVCGDLGIELGSCIATTKRMVIVENAKQMKRLKIPNVVRFAVVSPNGELAYYSAT